MATRSKSPAENRGPTIRDVAKAAGVSTATVSNVLRGTRFVGPDLQKRVHEAINSLSYTPNQVAASLRERRTRIIGVAVPDITTGLFTEIVRRIEKRAACTDYQIILADSEENVMAERARIGALIKRKIDGLIVIPCHDDSPVLEDLRRSKIPTVLVDRAAEGAVFDSVMADNCLGAREGTRHLLSLGHRHIMLLASEAGLRNIQERIQGYREALREAGFSDLENIVVAGANKADIVKPALEQLLRKESRPSAMFAVTQKMTVGALQVVAEAGLVIPKDISFLAFDDCEWFRAMRPFLSTISQPAEDFADQAWSMLMARLSNDRAPTFRKEVHCTLIVRESTIQYQAPPGGLATEQLGAVNRPAEKAKSSFAKDI